MDTKALVLLFTPAILSAQSAKAAGPDFARALDLKSFIEAARELQPPAPPPNSHNGHKYFSKDCVRIELGEGEGPVQSARTALTTQEFTEVCTPVPAPDTGLLVEHCFHKPGPAWTRTVTLLARPRQLPAGAKEVFEVCLEGKKLQLKPVSVSHEYTIEKRGEEDVLFILTPSEVPKAGTAAVARSVR